MRRTLTLLLVLCLVCGLIGWQASFYFDPIPSHHVICHDFFWISQLSPCERHVLALSEHSQVTSDKVGVDFQRLNILDLATLNTLWSHEYSDQLIVRAVYAPNGSIMWITKKKSSDEATMTLWSYHPEQDRIQEHFTWEHIKKNRPNPHATLSNQYIFSRDRQLLFYLDLNQDHECTLTIRSTATGRRVFAHSFINQPREFRLINSVNHHFGCIVMNEAGKHAIVIDGDRGLVYGPIALSDQKETGYIVLEAGVLRQRTTSTLNANEYLQHDWHYESESAFRTPYELKRSATEAGWSGVEKPVTPLYMNVPGMSKLMFALFGEPLRVTETTMQRGEYSFKRRNLFQTYYKTHIRLELSDSFLISECRPRGKLSGRTLVEIWTVPFPFPWKKWGYFSIGLCLGLLLLGKLLAWRFPGKNRQPNQDVNKAST